MAQIVGKAVVNIDPPHRGFPAACSLAEAARCYDMAVNLTI
jgi:hypothetical protein